VYYLLSKVGIFPMSIVPVNVFVIFYWINAYLGIFPLFFGWDPYRIAIGMTNKFLIFKVLLASSGSILLITITFFIFIKLHPTFKYKDMKYYSELNAPIITKVSKGEEDWFNFVIAIFVICLFVLTIYVLGVGELPIMSLLKGASSSELAVVRSDSSTIFSSKIHWFNLFMVELMKFTCYYFAARLLIIRANRIKSLILFVVSFLFCSFVAIMNVNKAPIVYLIFSLILIYFICKRQEINFRTALLIVAVGLSILFVFYKLFFTQGASVSSTIKSIVGRMFSGSITPAYFYFYLFPDNIPFLLGRSFPNPGGVFSRDQYNLTIEVMDFINPTNAEKGIIGTAPMAFWGESYANYGIPGIILFSVLVGVCLALATYLFHRIIGATNERKSSFPIGEYPAWSIAFIVWLTFELERLTFSGISLLLMNERIVVISFIYLVGLIMMKNKDTNNKLFLFNKRSFK